MRTASTAMEEDPFDIILSEAGAMSSSQEDLLRRSHFIRSAPPPPPPPSSSPPSSSSSSSSSSDDGGHGEDARRLGATAARYRISIRPVTMRSASDSHPSPSFSSPSSSDARGGCSGGEAAQPLGAEERPDDGDRGEELGFPGGCGDRLLLRSGQKQSSVSKRKRFLAEAAAAAATATAGTGKKRARAAFSGESTQEVVAGDFPVASPCGKRVAKRLGFGRDVTSQTNRSVVEDESGSRSASDEFAKFRYVQTGAPPLCYSPPELLKGPHGSPKPACGAALGVPQGMSPVARDPADEEVIKNVDSWSPQEAEKGGKAPPLRRPSPSIRRPAGEERDDGQREVVPPLGTELGASSPVEIAKQLGGQDAVEKCPSGGAQSPPPSAKTAPEAGDGEIRRPSDLVDLLLQFSKKPDKRLEDVDFLEVLAMKGIHIPPPRWWRPGGYDPPKKKV